MAYRYYHCHQTVPLGPVCTHSMLTNQLIPYSEGKLRLIQYNIMNLIVSVPKRVSMVKVVNSTHLRCNQLRSITQNVPNALTSDKTSIVLMRQYLTGGFFLLFPPPSPSMRSVAISFSKHYSEMVQNNGLVTHCSSSQDGSKHSSCVGP